MIILAAVVVLGISKNNPIESARKAKFKQDITTIRDELSMYLSSKYAENLRKFKPETVNLSGDEMVKELPCTEGYKYVIEVKTGKLLYKGADKKERTYFKEVLGESALIRIPVPEDWKTTIAVMTDDGVPIPIGFTYLTGTKDSGIVIKDENENEFVWIPATETSYVKDLTLPKDRAPTGEDTLPSGITDECYDVKKYGGFYIARYEAGIPQGDTKPSNKTGVPVSKKGAVVWTNIDYANSKASAESMICNDYVQTGLLTGTAWDTTCHFIEDYIKTLDKESSLSNSIYYGDYNDSTFKYINSSNEEVEKINGSQVKISAGSTEYTKTKNIYDLAGNVWEWTNENWGNGAGPFGRGGDYRSSGGAMPVSCRDGFDDHYTGHNVGFRTRLYIK